MALVRSRLVLAIGLGLCAAFAHAGAMSIASVNLPSASDMSAGSSAIDDAIRESARQATVPAPADSLKLGSTNPSLRFTASDTVRRANNRRIADALVRATPALDREQLLTVLDSGTLHTAFAKMLGSAGFAPDDLGDVLAGFLVVSWEMVNAQDTRPDAAGYVVLRNRIHGSLAANPRIASLTDADRQQAAETMGVLLMLSVATRDRLQQNRDMARMPKLQEDVRNAARQFGIDLRQVKFTKNGFEPR